MNRIIINRLSNIDFSSSQNADLDQSVQIEEYKKYYRLYEYTDDICVLEDNPLYPGIINYVKTGLLTEKEMVEALLHEE